MERNTKGIGVGDGDVEDGAIAGIVDEDGIIELCALGDRIRAVGFRETD